MKPKERRIMERDSQEDLVLKINQLAYQINRADIAEVTVSQSVTVLHVIIKRPYQEKTLLNASFGLACRRTMGATTQMLTVRLENVARDLQQILDAGQGPRGDAA